MQLVSAQAPMAWIDAANAASAEGSGDGFDPFLSTPSATARKYVARPLAGAFISGGAVASISSANVRTSPVWLLVGNVLSLLNFSLAVRKVVQNASADALATWLAAVDGLLAEPLPVLPPALLPLLQAVAPSAAMTRVTDSRETRLMDEECVRRGI